MEQVDWTQTSVKERIIRFIEENSISRHKFETSVGVSQGYLGKLSGDITLNLAKRITVAYPELNRDWLAWGEGEMLIDDSINDSTLNFIKSQAKQSSIVNTGDAGGDIKINSETATLKALLDQKESENKFLRTLVTNLTQNISNQVK